MSQVSKHKLEAAVYKKIFSLFPLFLTRMSNQNQGQVVINTLFSSTEKIVMAKRLSIAFMLIKGYSYPSISDKLKVSFGTIAKVAEITKNADTRFTEELEKIGKEEAFVEFLATIGYKLETLLPPKGGNWSMWRKGINQSSRESKQPY